MYLDVAIAALRRQQEIDRLRAKLAWYTEHVRCTDEGPCACNYRAVMAEAAIARAIPLCELGERYEQGLTDQDVSFGEVLEVLRALDGE